MFKILYERPQPQDVLPSLSNMSRILLCMILDIKSKK